MATYKPKSVKLSKASLKTPHVKASLPKPKSILKSSKSGVTKDKLVPMTTIRRTTVKKK